MKNTIIKVLSVVMAMVMVMGAVLVVSVSAADEACKHENYEQIGDPVAATCTEWGFTLYQCSDCKYYKTEFNTLEKPHNLTKGFEWIVKEEVGATCIADAYNVNVCPICETEVVVVIENTKSDEFHAWGEWTKVEATCTEAGNQTRKCTICEKEETKTLSIEGHKWVAQEADYVEPKCTAYVAAYGLTDEKLAYGSMPYVCSDCGATRTVEIKPVDYHKWTAMEAEADTCDVIGHNKGTFCLWCKTGKDPSKDIVTDTLKHQWTIDYSKEYKAPTCEATGFWTLKCSNCSTSYIHTEKATGHEWNKEKPTTYVEPTCTTWGYKLYGCTRCGMKFENESIAPLGHKWAEEGTKYGPNCTEAGRIEYACTNKWHDKDGFEVACDAVNKVEDKNAPALGHGELINVDAVLGDCTTNGTAAGKKCSVCGKFVEGGQIITAPGHKYVNSVCTVAGKYDQICDVCGDIKLEGATVATSGKESHALLLNSEIPATCTTPGTAFYTCKYCDKYLNEPLKQIIPALGHKAKETKLPATCTSDGYILVTCEREGCGQQISNTVLAKDPNGHTFADGVDAVKATCTTPGFEHGICLNCGHIVSKDIPALGHDIVTIPAKAATCTDPGNKAGEYCKRCDYEKVAEVINPLGHDDQKDASKIAGYAATCTTKGLTDGRKCLRCGVVTVKQEEIPAYDHKLNGEGKQFPDAVVVVKTCKDAGRIGYIANECPYCDEAIITNFEYIPEHVYPDTWSKKAKTCENDGYDYRLCENCGLEQIKEGSVVEATGHKNKAGEVFSAACSYADDFDHKCVNAHCDYKGIGSVVPEKHNYVQKPLVIDYCAGEYYVLYVCDDCGHRKVTDADDFTPQHEDEIFSVPTAVATETKAAETVYKCKNCGRLRSEYTPYGGIRIKTEIKNLTNPGAHFVEGTKKIQIIVSIRCDKREFHNFNAKFTYDKTALVFKSGKVTSELSGATISGAVHKPDDGKLNITAFVANNADGEMGNVALTGEWQEFIVLEFAVNSEAFKDKTAGVLNPVAGFSHVGNLYDGSEYKSYFFDFNGVGVICTKDNFQNLETPIYKLGDANNDGVVNSADFARIQQLILTDAYMAEADLDGDGEVKAKDLNYLQKLIVGSYTVKQLADGR